MKMKRGLLALILVLALALAVGLGLLLDQREQEQLLETYAGEYDIIITEICAKNETVISDNSGKYRDYIEIYNRGETVSLKGLYLTDGRTEGPAFEDILFPAGSYRLIFLGDELTGFGISASGESLQLVAPTGKIIAQTNTAILNADQVMLYEKTGYVLSYDASPGFSNDAQGIKAFREGTAATEPKLLISELLTENVSTLPDEKGLYCDVVELYNASEESLSLSGYCLSDSKEQRFRYRMPDVDIPAGSYLLLYCDGEDYIGANGEIHVNFGLSHGDELVLTDPLGAYVSLTPNFPGADLSLSLMAEGSYETSPASLGFSNDELGMEQFALGRINTDSALIISELLLSESQVPYLGQIRDVVEIQNRSQETVSTKGWYLSDGGDPYEFALPERELAPGECMVLLCEAGFGENCTGFALSQEDVLCLTGPDFRHAVPVSCDFAQLGMSLLAQEGQELSYLVGEISLGYANTPQNAALYLENTLSKGLVISELMSANMSYLKGSYGTTCDWLELYNASEEAVNLAEYCLSNDPNQPSRYSLPEQTVEPGEYCVILLSEKGQNLLRGYPVVTFNLSSDGESVYLSKNGLIEDYVHLPALPTDTSYGRPEGAAGFTTLSKVTPGSKNGAEAELSATPQVNLPQGSYDDVEYLEIELSGPGEIYYTTDASYPTSYKNRYTGPIKITKTTVIRAVCCEEGKKASEILNLTYVVNENNELAVACLVAEPAQLFSEEYGIYMQGPNVPEDEEFPYHSANYWWNTERRATLSLFDTDGSGFSVNCGISIFGGYSRALGKKSFGIFFRDYYGDGSLNYPVFGEEGLDSFESLVLRGCGQDCLKAMMRDPMISSRVAAYTDVAVQKYKPVNLYINGRYWGIYYIREKINENYVAGNFNADREDVTLCMANGRSSAEYVALIDYVRNNDLTKQECYEYVCSQVDIQEYIDYIFAEMWICNTDNGNIKFCKTTEGKWTWIMYDVDYSFTSYTFNAVYDHTFKDGTGAGNNFSTTLIRGLLENPDFEEQFLRRAAWQMNNIWEEESMIAWIDDFEAMIAKDMEKDCSRWGRNYSSWQRDVEYLRTYAKNRNRYMLIHIKDYFGLTDEQMREYGFHV